ncbi:hypothetical protein BDV93DRAFT_563081 [Ceratobasidium sp. AG-I]|nr:hypothetical protein BDV93DRAFT_563081 [Ceratobasidium sp. AG-I]
MTASFSFTLDPSYGSSLEEYLESNQHFTLVKYPVDRVLSAIKTITTNDPPEVVSDATLEAVLSVAYYPKHLELLDVDFYAPLYEILATYLDHNTLLERSFGVLLMQVYGIFTMVEFLVVHRKLLAFLKSLALAQARGVVVFYWLSHEVAQIFGLDQDPSMNTVVQRFRDLLPTLRGSHTQSLPLNFLILERAFEARGSFSRACSRIPGFGWSLVLVKMWPTVQLMKQDPKGPNNKLEKLRQLQDLACRCLLVAPLHERCIVGSLDWVIDCTRETSFADSFGEPQGSGDFELILNTTLVQLSTCPAKKIAGDLKYLSTMAQYALQFARTMNRYDTYPQLLEAAYTRLWTEITSSSSDRHPVDNVVGYGVDLLGHTCEGCMRAEMTSGSESATLDIVLSLSNLDFINLVGRLFLSYAARADESDGRWVDEMLSQALEDTFLFGKTIAKYTKSLKSAFQPYYLDWLKVLWHISQLSSMSLPSSQLILPHLEQLLSNWLHLGSKFGYSDDNDVALACSYARCPGFKLADRQNFACGRCFHAIYCSARCQQADWTYGDRPHSERCKEQVAMTTLFEEIARRKLTVISRVPRLS